MTQTAKLIARLYYGSIFILIVGAILWLNNIEFAILTLTIGASIMAIYYFIQFLNPKLDSPYDWSLVYPELNAVNSNKK